MFYARSLHTVSIDVRWQAIFKIFFLYSKLGGMHMYTVQHIERVKRLNYSNKRLKVINSVSGLVSFSFLQIFFPFSFYIIFLLLFLFGSYYPTGTSIYINFVEKSSRILRFQLLFSLLFRSFDYIFLFILVFICVPATTHTHTQKPPSLYNNTNIFKWIFCMTSLFGIIILNS